MITISKTFTSMHEINADFQPKEGWIFFDIETTGFSSRNCHVYLIGCLYFQNNVCHQQQWLIADEQEETLLLTSFFEFIKSFNAIFHYNGNGFDIPFLLEKCKKHDLAYQFNGYENIDIYKKIQPYKKQLRLDNLKQKTLEQFLNIQRDDAKNGGELIQVYLDYRQTGSKQMESLLLLHNEEDLRGMLQLMPLFSYPALFEGEIANPAFEQRAYQDLQGNDKKEAVFSFQLKHALPRHLSYGQGAFYLYVSKCEGKLTVKLTRQELKYFFPDYKDYYYLPLEDASIHKSVAFYVDKNFRTKAKAADCYSKKNGLFLPQEQELIKPFFKKDYQDKTTYFEITDEFQHNQALQLAYIQHVLSILRK